MGYLKNVGEREEERILHVLDRLMALCKKELKSNPFTVKTGDARTDSGLEEKKITAMIERFLYDDEDLSRFNIKVIKTNDKTNNNRSWMDIGLSTNMGDEKNTKEEILIPINIKITNISQGVADNLNCKTGMMYVITGKTPEELGITNNSSWEKIIKRLKEYKDSPEKCNKERYIDYYFMVFDKKDCSKSFVNSLKHINKLSPNGSNLPFQCVWKNNTDRITRTYEEAKNNILKTFEESLEKQAKPYFLYHAI